MDFKDIKINGRYQIKDNELYLFNSGSGISFKMKGTSFIVALNSEIGPCYYYLIIDRDYENKTKIFVPEHAKHQYLFNDDKEHLIDIVKANEAKDCTLIIKGLIIDGFLLTYDHKYEKKAIIYGDSTIAGYGILSHEEASIHTSDGVKDFLYRSLYELNFEMDILCASFSAYTEPKTIGICDYKDKVAINSSISWEAQNKYDILIISLGCNDASYISEQPNRVKELTKMFIEKYKSLIDSEIKHNKNIKILMVYGTLKEKQAYNLIEETYSVLKPLYKKLYIHKFSGDNTGAANHAFITAHDKMAEELKTVLKTVLK